MVGQPENTVELVAGADVGVLISKDWLEWADESKPLIARARFIFCHSIEVAYKDKVNYHSIAVTGNVLIRDHLGRLGPPGQECLRRLRARQNPTESCRCLSPTSWLGNVNSHLPHQGHHRI